MMLAVAARLYDELGRPLQGEAAHVPDLTAPSGRPMAISQDLTAEDQRLVASFRGALAQIAMALYPEAGAASPNGALAALEGAEGVMGAELLHGNPDQLPKLMPSFVFLVALQIVDQDRALELSGRVSELIEEEQRARPGG